MQGEGLRLFIDSQPVAADGLKPQADQPAGSD